MLEKEKQKENLKNVGRKEGKHIRSVRNGKKQKKN